ncbi:MAG: transposase family protein [Deltaproteobacteria bacterium]|nr:transposase family protein [Deltaproteobacteria bacterium]
MSTSLLYHGFGIRGYKYVRTHHENGSVLFTIRQNTKEMRCATCGSRRVISRGQVWRRFRSVPIGLKPVWILLAIQRVYRLVCALVQQVNVGFADPVEVTLKPLIVMLWNCPGI